MQLPQWLAKFNRRVTNPVQRLWAGWLPGFGILEHTGRKSGTEYRTPLNVFSTDDGVAILLSYGPNRDWLKNIASSGEARLKRHGKTFAVADPHVVTKAQAATRVVGPARFVFPRIPFDSAVLLTRVQTSSEG